jgi:hypothetical protein
LYLRPRYCVLDSPVRYFFGDRLSFGVPDGKSPVVIGKASISMGHLYHYHGEVLVVSPGWVCENFKVIKWIPKPWDNLGFLNILDVVS